MSAIAGQIKSTQDKDGMLRRALERIIQLYTDKSHFVYELLQNAEDAEASRIKFVQYDDRLEVFHDGKPFTSQNLQGLCDIGKSDKADNLNQIGEFGVGFKSVFGICEIVKLFSEPANYSKEKEVNEYVQFAVEIHDFTQPEDITMEPMESQYTTRFVFPYAIGETFSGFQSFGRLKTAIAEKLQNLGITTLLFMKNLQQIDYEINLDGVHIEGEYLLEKKIINDHCSLVSAMGTTDRENNSETEEEIISYLKFTKPIQEGIQQSVDIAFPVVVTENEEFLFKPSSNPYVSVYFPTETESKLDFIVQGPYRTTPNRSSIPADDSDNKRLAIQTADLLRDAVRELRDLGKLNMSFLRILPLDERRFDNFDLFYPLYRQVTVLFSIEKVIPCKSGGYVSAKSARIARQERLTSLLSDSLLTELIADEQKYHWLPTVLTETNREYEKVYRFLNGEMKIPVIRPEDLRNHINDNSHFLQNRDDEWLVEFYSVMENVGAAFSKAKNETNMLTANIVKTSNGDFVAPYRKTEAKQYIPNVFLPSEKIKSEEINFVDPTIYRECKHFFDDILQLTKPNEYEFLINGIKKKYGEGYKYEEESHMEDLRNLLKYKKYEEYSSEVDSIIKEYIVLRCKDGTLRNAYRTRLFFPKYYDIDFEGYFENVSNSVKFIDDELYLSNGFSYEDLCEIGVKASILVGESTTQGVYETGKKGKQPEWWTPGDFRWKLSIELIKDTLKYISSHPTAKDSMIKSQVILRILLNNEQRLHGIVRIGGVTKDLDDENCDLVRILRGEVIPGWNGKWLYTNSFELVSQKAISKYDLNVDIYGSLKSESLVYEWLGFKKTKDDIVDEIKKGMSKTQVDDFFESELRQRFGITSNDLSERFGNQIEPIDIVEEMMPFPVVRVKNWESLRKHAAEMLIYADPVRYDYAVRHIRISNHAKESRAYLMNMYRYDNRHQFACQMCHEPSSTIESVQLFNNPETELDPMNICLCPNCAAKYRKMRNDETAMKRFKNQIFSITELDVINNEQVIIPVEDAEIWFAQTHFAEIQELMRLEDDVKETKKTDTANEQAQEVHEEGDQSGLNVYKGYIGKHLIRKKDGFEGIIQDVNEKYFFVKVIAGKDKGKETKVKVEFVIENKNIYEIKDK